jgi:hypothetical protein
MEFILFLGIYLLIGQMGGIYSARYEANFRAWRYQNAVEKLAEYEDLRKNNGYYYSSETERALEEARKNLDDTLAWMYLIGVAAWPFILLYHGGKQTSRGFMKGAGLLSGVLAKGTDLEAIRNDLRRKELEEHNARLEKELNVKDPLDELETSPTYYVDKKLVGDEGRKAELAKQNACDHKYLQTLPRSLRGFYNSDKFCNECGKLV